MSDRHEELLNVYDEEGRVVGARPRREAKASGLAVGAVNVLLVSGAGEVLLQRRPDDEENGGLWDKTVGGHVAAGEDFDETALREAGEELFDDPHDPRIALAPVATDLSRLGEGADLRRTAVMRRVALQLSLRDVRHAAGGGARSVLYHVAVYLGRTDIPIADFLPQPDEIAELRYAPAAEVDALLLAGRLAPNMAFLWLTQGRAALALAGGAARR